MKAVDMFLRRRTLPPINRPSAFARNCVHSPASSSLSSNNNRRSASSAVIVDDGDCSSFSSGSRHKKMTRSAERNTKNANDSCATYEQCVHRLYRTNFFHPMKVGLKNIQAIHTALGCPMDRPNRIIIHVAGSNGKGSVAVKTAKALELAGHRVGLFVSPHISSFRERMTINGVCITESQVEEYLPHIYQICEEHGIPATFFELTTALAFLFFDRCHTDVIVLEVGLGGRLDATNVIQKPAISVITSIGLEHTALLGDTIEKIATEKAGIIKQGCPVVVGPKVPYDVVSSIAREKQAEGCYLADMSDFRSISHTEKDMMLQGGIVDYDVENSLVAATVLRTLREKLRNDPHRKLLPLSDHHIQQATSFRPPCRFEELSVCVPNSQAIGKNVHVILDIAHNPPAMTYLIAKLQSKYPNRKMRFLVGFSNDKDIFKCVTSILDAVNMDPECIHVTQACTPRAATLEEMWNASPILKQSHWDATDRSIVKQVQSALVLSQKQNELLVVCGSVFLMAEAREALGIIEPKDSSYVAAVAGSGYRNIQDNIGDIISKPT